MIILVTGPCSTTGVTTISFPATLPSGDKHVIRSLVTSERQSWKPPASTWNRFDSYCLCVELAEGGKPSGVSGVSGVGGKRSGVGGKPSGVGGISVLHGPLLTMSLGVLGPSDISVFSSEWKCIMCARLLNWVLVVPSISSADERGIT